jgi:hypothetical protein
MALCLQSEFEENLVRNWLCIEEFERGVNNFAPEVTHHVRAFSLIVSDRIFQGEIGTEGCRLKFTLRLVRFRDFKKGSQKYLNLGSRKCLRVSLMQYLKLLQNPIHKFSFIKLA